MLYANDNGRFCWNSKKIRILTKVYTVKIRLNGLNFGNKKKYIGRQTRVHVHNMREENMSSLSILRGFADYWN